MHNISSQLYDIELKSLPNPYNQLKELMPFNGHGFYLNARWIEKLMQSNNMVIVIEVGSWLGTSTRHMASLLASDGLLYAVDTWQGSVENFENAQHRVLLPTLYEQFLSNVIHAGLTDTIIPVKMTSLQAASYLESVIDHADLVYIDAAHDTQSVYLDLVAYFPYVCNHKGVLCGDDWMHEPVRLAVLKFAQQHNLTIYADDNFWFVAEQQEYGLRSFVHASDNVWKFPKNT